MKSRELPNTGHDTTCCNTTSCSNCKRCKTVNYEQTRIGRSEWKTNMQLYGAEAHNYYFYSEQLHNHVNALKNSRKL